MTRHMQFKTLFLELLIFLFCTKLFSENISDSVYNFSLDIPEGFSLAEVSDDQMSYHFTHPNYPVEFILKIYDDNSYTSSKLPLETALNKLSASMNIDVFPWNETDICSLTNFSMNLDQEYSGWAVSAPLKKQNAYVVILSYCPSDVFDSCAPFVMSIINSLCTNEDYYCYPGIIASYAYPKEGKKDIKLKIGKNTVNSSIDITDVEAAQFIISMEFSVLKLYSNHNLWKEAWQRYYRMIYRDEYGRLGQFSSDFFDTIYPLCQKENPENPSLCYAQKILSWVQDFNYKRDTESASSSDFTSLPAVLCGQGNDCDSRSLLVCTLLRAANLESFMLISNEYSHAMATFENIAPGQKYTIEGTNREFLMGETTAKVTWGTIAQDQADRSKWIPVILP